jgi:mannosyltransferase OCH1-like enzyme
MAVLIPRVVHRMWFGDRRMPVAYEAYGRSWEAFGYEVRTWSESDLPELINAEMFEAIERNGVNVGGGNPAVGVAVQRADLVGYELVWRFGGIVANTDIEPLRSLDPLLEDVEAFACYEQGEFVSNALIGGVAGHAFWRAVIDRLPVRYGITQGLAMNEQTGPHLLTEVRRMRDDLTVFDSWVHCPYLYGEMHKEGRPDLWETPEPPYCEHHWGHRHPELLEDRWPSPTVT